MPAPYPERPRTNEKRPARGERVAARAARTAAGERDRRAQPGPPRAGVRTGRPGRVCPPARVRGRVVSAGSALVADAVGDPGLEGPDLDEAWGGGLGEQAAGLGEGGELGVVDGVLGFAGDDADGALEE